jgi:nitrite reductase (NO-forming)
MAFCPDALAAGAPGGESHAENPPLKEHLMPLIHTDTKTPPRPPRRREAHRTATRRPRDPSMPDERREWLTVGIGLVALLAILATVLSVFAIAGKEGSGSSGSVAATAAPAAAAPADPANQPAPTLAQAKGVAFEKFAPVDPTLPAVPAGAVKHFTVGVDQHVVQVSPDLAPTEAWTYTVNGKVYRGAAASPPIVVNQGDTVEIRFVNGASKAMHVNMAHSIDFHAAEVAPSKYYVDVAPGKSETIRFVAKHPGVFMYHCATQPVLMHVGAGMAGMMVVRPRGLPPVARELWITQGEYYLGQPGAPTNMAKLQAEKPDVIAFNGYANQYKVHPIPVRVGEKVRLWVLNTGPSKWSAFHVIGTVFDKAVVENTAFRDSQTMSLAPSQGGYAEFTLDQPGKYPFVTHAFGDMAKGAAGMLQATGGGAAATPAGQAATGMKGM